MGISINWEEIPIQKMGFILRARVELEDLYLS